MDQLEVLPHGGTVLDLRREIATQAERGMLTTRRFVAKSMPWSDEEAATIAIAFGCAGYGWALASLLKWVEKYGEDAAIEAASIVQLILIDGGSQGYCNDLLTKPE